MPGYITGSSAVTTFWHAIMLRFKKTAHLSYLIILSVTLSDRLSTVHLDLGKTYKHQNGHDIRHYKLAEAETLPTMPYLNYRHLLQ
jgi:hypothetical protein